MTDAIDKMKDPIQQAIEALELAKKHMNGFSQLDQALQALREYQAKQCDNYSRSEWRGTGGSITSIERAGGSIKITMPDKEGDWLVTLKKRGDVITMHEAAKQPSEGVLKLVEQQANDDGLWFVAKTAPEAYLQQELRKLHTAIEGQAPQGAGHE